MRNRLGMERLIRLEHGHDEIRTVTLTDELKIWILLNLPGKKTRKGIRIGIQIGFRARGDIDSPQVNRVRVVVVINWYHGAVWLHVTAGHGEEPSLFFPVWVGPLVPLLVDVTESVAFELRVDVVEAHILVWELRVHFLHDPLNLCVQLVCQDIQHAAQILGQTWAEDVVVEGSAIAHGRLVVKELGIPCDNEREMLRLCGVENPRVY
jgi:hypothetical protein